MADGPHRIGTMRGQLRKAMVRSISGDRKKFIPLDKLQEIVSPLAVNKELEACPRLDCYDRQSLVQSIFDTPGCRKIFAILALLEQADKILLFTREGFSDRDLPLYRAGGCPDGCGSRPFVKELQAGWPEFVLEAFEEYQWMLLAPAFDFSSDIINHYVLSRNVPLPFLDDPDYYRADGGFSDVRRVRIHPAHHIPHSATSTVSFRAHKNPTARRLTVLLGG